MGLNGMKWNGRGRCCNGLRTGLRWGREEPVPNVRPRICEVSSPCWKMSGESVSGMVKNEKMKKMCYVRTGIIVVIADENPSVE